MYSIYPRRHHDLPGAMVGAEVENFEIWTLQIALKLPSWALTEAYSEEK